MKQKTYLSPQIQSITMLSEGMIAVSGQNTNSQPPLSDTRVTEENLSTIGSRGMDESNNSIWGE